jgi:hypothetical protein
VPRSIAEAVTDGLAALARMQTREGYFPLYTGTAGSMWTRCDPIFSTAYIMMGIGRLLPAQHIAHAVDYIANSRRSDGLWHYDPALDIPPDADATACALAALARDGRRADIADGADLLRAFWRSEGGPFRTWWGEGAWSRTDRDDPVVNCHVLYALRLLGVPATDVERAAVAALVRRSVNGPRYYGSPGAVALACRRAGIGPEDWPPIVAAPPKDGLGLLQWFTATGRQREEIVPLLLRLQRPDGSWPIATWVTGAGAPPPIWGSPAITTALTLEALLAQRGGARPAAADHR